MRKKFLNIPKFTLCLCLLIGVGQWNVYAAPVASKQPANGVLMDRTQPFVVEADTVIYSDITQTSLFKGRVILTQGGMRIEAGQIETIVDPEGYQYATAEGQVRLTQKRAGTSETLKGEAEQLIYDGKTNLVSLSGGKNPARIQRVDNKGALIDQITGADLTYNLLTEVFTSNAQRTGRTHVIISPRNSITKSKGKP